MLPEEGILKIGSLWQIVLVIIPTSAPYWYMGRTDQLNPAYGMACGRYEASALPSGGATKAELLSCPFSPCLPRLYFDHLTGISRSQFMCLLCAMLILLPSICAADKGVFRFL